MNLKDALSLLGLKKLPDLDGAKQALARRKRNLKQRIDKLSAGSSSRKKLAQELDRLSEAFEIVRKHIGESDAPAATMVMQVPKEGNQSDPVAPADAGEDSDSGREEPLGTAVMPVPKIGQTPKQERPKADKSPPDKGSESEGPLRTAVMSVPKPDQTDKHDGPNQDEKAADKGSEPLRTAVMPVPKPDRTREKGEPLVGGKSADKGAEADSPETRVDRHPPGRVPMFRWTRVGGNRRLLAAGLVVLLVGLLLARLIPSEEEPAEEEVVVAGEAAQPPQSVPTPPKQEPRQLEPSLPLRDQVRLGYDELAKAHESAKSAVEVLAGQVTPLKAKDPEALSAAEQSLIEEHTSAVEALALLEEHVVDELFLLDLESALAAALPDESSEATGRLERLRNVIQRRLWTLGQLESALEAKASASTSLALWESLGLRWPVSEEEILRLAERAGFNSADAPETSPAQRISGERMLATLLQAQESIQQADAALAAGRFSEASAEYAEAMGRLDQGTAWAENRTLPVDENVALLFGLGRDAVEDDRLTSPASESALYYLRQIEAVAPNRAEIDELRRLIQSRYLALIRDQLDGNAIEKAESYAARAVRVGSDTREMDQIRQVMADYRSILDERETALVEAAESHAAAGRTEDLAEAIEQLRSEFPQSRSLESLEGQMVGLRLLAGQAVSELIGIEMVALPTGSFQMGFEKRGFLNLFGRRNEQPVHEVAISRPIAMSRHEITVGQFRKFVEDTGYVTDAERSGTSSAFGGTKEITVSGNNWQHDYLGNEAADNQPVIHVSWRDASAFTDWMSERTGALYRLPSESEHEYAARAGSTGNQVWETDRPPPEIDNFLGDQDRVPAEWDAMGGTTFENAVSDYSDGYFGPAPVGSFEPNKFGIEGLLGNVAEWTLDCYFDNYRSKGGSQDARSKQDCTTRVVRGLHWGSGEKDLRVTYREPRDETFTSTTIGFRVVREIQQD